jgi:hypothetical protein
MDTTVCKFRLEAVSQYLRFLRRPLETDDSDLEEWLKRVLPMKVQPSCFSKCYVDLLTFERTIVLLQLTFVLRFINEYAVA